MIRTFFFAFVLMATYHNFKFLLYSKKEKSLIVFDYRYVKKLIFIYDG